MVVFWWAAWSRGVLLGTHHSVADGPSQLLGYVLVGGRSSVHIGRYVLVVAVGLRLQRRRTQERRDARQELGDEREVVLGLVQSVERCGLWLKRTVQGGRAVEERSGAASVTTYPLAEAASLSRLRLLKSCPPRSLRSRAMQRKEGCYCRCPRHQEWNSRCGGRPERVDVSGCLEC